MSKLSTRRFVGMGSNLQELFGDFMITLYTSDSGTEAKFSKSGGALLPCGRSSSTSLTRGGESLTNIGDFVMKKGRKIIG